MKRWKSCIAAVKASQSSGGWGQGKTVEDKLSEECASFIAAVVFLHQFMLAWGEYTQ
jgi:hypothetical protein